MLKLYVKDGCPHYWKQIEQLEQEASRTSCTMLIVTAPRCSK